MLARVTTHTGKMGPRSTEKKKLNREQEALKQVQNIGANICIGVNSYIYWCILVQIYVLV